MRAPLHTGSLAAVLLPPLLLLGLCCQRCSAGPQPGAPWPQCNRDGRGTGYAPFFVSSSGYVQWQANWDGSAPYMALSREAWLLTASDRFLIMRNVPIGQSEIVFEAANKIIGGPAVDQDGNAVFVDEAGVVYWVDPDTVEQYWAIPTNVAAPSHPVVVMDVNVGNGPQPAVFVVGDDGLQFVIDRQTLSDFYPGQFLPPVFDGDFIYTADNTGVQKRGLDFSTVVLVDNEYAGSVSSLMVTFDGTLVVAYTDGMVRTLDAAFNEVWAHDFSDPISVRPAISPDNFLYVATQTEVHMLNASNGNVLRQRIYLDNGEPSADLVAHSGGGVLVPTTARLFEWRALPLELSDVANAIGDPGAVTGQLLVGADRQLIYPLGSHLFGAGGFASLCFTTGQALSPTLVTPYAYEDLCDDCPAGNIVSTAQTCTLCPPGSAPNEFGDFCDPCLSGFYSGVDSCQICSAGKYAPPCLQQQTKYKPHAKQYQGDFDLWNRVMTFIPTIFDDGRHDFFVTNGYLDNMLLQCCESGDTYTYTPLNFTEGDEVVLQFDFAFPFFGSSASSVYVGQRGYVSILPAEQPVSSVTLAEHWARPMISALFSEYQSDSGTVYWGLDPGFRAIVAFENMEFPLTNQTVTFMVTFSSSGTIDMYYKANAAPDVTNAIVGVSPGVAPDTVTWVQTPFSQMLEDCKGNSMCYNCEEGTGAVDKGASECEPCPGRCSGHGFCNPKTVQCECDDLWAGLACDDRQNITSSMVFGFIGLGLLLMLAVPCVCMGADHKFTKSISRRKLDIFLWTVFVNLEIARFYKQVIAQKQALSYLLEQQAIWSSTQRDRRVYKFRDLMLALAQFVRMGFFLLVIMFIVLIMTVLQMVGNIFLIAKGLYSDNLDQLEERIDEISEKLRVLFSQFGFGWIAVFCRDILSVLRNINLKFIAFDTLEVTCTGSQAPGTLFLNLLIILAIVTLISLNIFPLLKITLKSLVATVSDMLGIRRMLGQRGSRMIVLFLGLLLGVLEGLFKYAVQLLASFMDYDSFFPYHRNNPNCDLAASNMDISLASCGTALAYIFFLPALHIVLRTFVPGIPRGVDFGDKKSKQVDSNDDVPVATIEMAETTPTKSVAVEEDVPAEVVEERRSAAHSGSKAARKVVELPDNPSTRIIERFQPDDPDLTVSKVLQKPHFKEQKRIRSELMNFEPAKNVPNSSWLVRQICSELFGLGCGRDRTRTLRLYLYCMGWKLWKLIQISFGYWDDDAIRAFNIKQLAAKFDDDISDDESYHMTMLSVVGVAHTLFWQLCSWTVVLSKFAEAMNREEHSPFVIAPESALVISKFWTKGLVANAGSGADDEVSGRIANVVQVAVTANKRSGRRGETQEHVQFIVRGVGTNFVQELGNGGTITIFDQGDETAADREVRGAVLNVQEVINDVVLRASMPKQNVGRIPRAALVHLQDYHVDEAVVATFSATKQKEGCCSGCCCSSMPTDAEEGATRRGGVSHDDGDPPRDFADELDALADPERSFAYSIQAHSKRIGPFGLISLFAMGRFYKCLVAVVQFAMELVMVVNPSVTWLAAAVAISVPSIVVESVDQLHSLGVRADTLYTFLAKPGTFLASVCGLTYCFPTEEIVDARRLSIEVPAPTTALPVTAQPDISITATTDEL